jgi:hypothetical protein
MADTELAEKLVELRGPNSIFPLDVYAVGKRTGGYTFDLDGPKAIAFLRSIADRIELSAADPPNEQGLVLQSITSTQRAKLGSYAMTTVEIMFHEKRPPEAEGSQQPSRSEATVGS